MKKSFSVPRDIKIAGQSSTLNKKHLLCGFPLWFNRLWGTSITGKLCVLVARKTQLWMWRKVKPPAKKSAWTRKKRLDIQVTPRLVFFTANCGNCTRGKFLLVFSMVKDWQRMLDFTLACNTFYYTAVLRHYKKKLWWWLVKNTHIVIYASQDQAVKIISTQDHWWFGVQTMNVKPLWSKIRYSLSKCRTLQLTRTS